MSKTIISNFIQVNLAQCIKEMNPDRIYLLTDTETKVHCLPLLSGTIGLENAQIITMQTGDENKNITSLSMVWEYLSTHQATRKSLLINLGGGVVTDLGGFAASTFKRGIRYINIPTTLLAVVDAATGGKTGINFNGLKNEIGVINAAEYVLIDVQFFQTLTHENLLSGFAEMLKHALISNRENWNELVQLDLEEINLEKLSSLLGTSLRVKELIVKQDPHEQGIRKALNFGHTIGHAFESLSHEQGHGVLHGYAVIWGMLCEAYMSLAQGFPKDVLMQLRQIVKEHYGFYTINCKDYERLYELMKHDKKNEATNINFTLLADIGDTQLNCHVTKEDIFEALDFYREVAP